MDAKEPAPRDASAQRLAELTEKREISLKRLKVAWERSKDDSTLALYAAIHDTEVFRLWLNKTQDQGYTYLGPIVYDIEGHEGQKGVLFRFESGSAYWLDPADFLAIVQLQPEVKVPEDVEVLQIVDPYATADKAGVAGGCSASGDASFGIRYEAGYIVAECRASGKVKCFGKTVLSASATLTIQKRLSEIQEPCSDVEATASHFRLTGKLCHRGNAYCLEDGKVYLSYKGTDTKIADVSGCATA